MELQAGTVIAGMQLSSLPQTPLSITCRMFGSSSRHCSKTNSGGAQSRPITRTFFLRLIYDVPSSCYEPNGFCHCNICCNYCEHLAQLLCCFSPIITPKRAIAVQKKQRLSQFGSAFMTRMQTLYQCSK